MHRSGPKQTTSVVYGQQNQTITRGRETDYSIYIFSVHFEMYFETFIISQHKKKSKLSISIYQIDILKLIFSLFRGAHVASIIFAILSLTSLTSFHLEFSQFSVNKESLLRICQANRKHQQRQVIPLNVVVYESKRTIKWSKMCNKTNKNIIYK